MHITVLLALAELTAGVPLPEGADSTVVVLRLKCPNADDLAVCKELFKRDGLLADALLFPWLAKLPGIKMQKTTAEFLKKHLRVTTSGRDTIRIWIKANLSKNDRSALSNAVFRSWTLWLVKTETREKLADVANVYQAYVKARKRSQAAHRKLMQVIDERMYELRSKDPSAIKKQNQAEEKARQESKKANREMDDARNKFCEALGKGPPFVVVQLADGPGKIELTRIIIPVNKDKRAGR